MRRNAPRVSIIVPIHNAGDYLKDCLESVVNQTLKDIEVICIDDASTDNSREILTSYAERDSRIRTVFYEENRSASQARKDGCALAEGEYMMFLDADDTYELTACEELVEQMDATGVDMLQFGTFVDAVPGVRQSAKEWFEQFVKPYPGYLRGRKIFDTCFKSRKFRFNIWNKIYKSALCKKAFAYVENGSFPKAQDLYAFFIIAWFAESYLGISKKYYHYHYGRGVTGSGKAMSLTTFRRHCSQSRVAEKCKEFLKAQGAWDAYEEVWNQINRDLINECIGHLINHVTESDAACAMDVLADNWDGGAINDAIERNWKKEKGRLLTKCAGARSLCVGVGAETDGKIISVSSVEEEKPLVDADDAEVPPGFDRVIPVVFATNDKYSIYAGVAIESILKHAGARDYYRIYVLHDGLTAEHIAALEGTESQQASVACIHIGSLLLKKQATLYEKMHFTKEMYFRFVIAEVFPFYSKVIYLDCDLVACADISKMIPDDMGDALIAAARNYVLPHTEKRLRRDFHIDPQGYMNSGVLVINVEQWVREGITDRCFELLRTIPEEKLLYCDQDILNVACEGRIYYLDPAWNYYWNMLYGNKAYADICRPVTQRVGENFYILHFASNIKPWQSPELPLSKYFWKYARMSAFYEEILMNNMKQDGKPMAAKKNDRPAAAGSGKQDDQDLLRRIRQLEMRLSVANQEIQNIHNSWTYRIGRVITWLPRMIRGGVRCFQEHGLSYTLDRVLVRLHLKEDPYQQKVVPVIPRGQAAKRPAAGEVRETAVKPVKRDYDYYCKLPPEKYEEELKLWYERIVKEPLNLENPQTFNEKLQWLKLYDSTPLKTRLADKYLVRDWVKERIGEEYLVPLLGVWDSFDEIDFDQLPDQFALKANHGSGWNVIVKDKSKLDRRDAREKFSRWMQKNYAFNYGFELHYLNIKPKIIAEKYIENIDQVYDYKVLCFDGEPKFIWVDSDRFTDHHRTFYTLEWEKMPVEHNYPAEPKGIAKPKNLDKMIQFARQLSQGFAHARVDFYEVEDQLYFGEITFTSGSGTERTTPRSFEKEMGDMLTLPPKSPIPERKF